MTIKLKTAFESVKTTADMRAACDKIVTLIKEKKIDINQLSLREIADSTLGVEAVRQMMQVDDSKLALESVAPVNLSAFTNITGNLVFEAAVTAYDMASPIGSELVTQETAKRDGGRDIGFANIDDTVLVVQEGEEYPDMKFGEDYVDIPTSQKRGAKIGLTREAVFFDETGRILEQARAIGERMGTNREVRTLRTVMGLDNSFKRQGVSRNTYVATGGGDPRVNLQAATPLVDWTSVDAAQQLFNNMGDDRVTKEPIQVTPKIILVPQQLEMTARRLFSATEIRTGSAGGNVQTYSPNQLVRPIIVTSPWVKKILVDAGVNSTIAGGRWFYGDFKRAFKYRTLFPLGFRAAMHDKDDFERDVVAQFRVDERGVPRVVAPWYVAQFDAA